MAALCCERPLLNAERTVAPPVRSATVLVCPTPPGNVRTSRPMAQEPRVAVDVEQLAALLKPVDRGPLHSRLEVGLRGLIRSGQVPAGAALPGEHDLAAGLGLSR